MLKKGVNPSPNSMYVVCESPSPTPSPKWSFSLRPGLCWPTNGVKRDRVHPVGLRPDWKIDGGNGDGDATIGIRHNLV